MHVSTTLTRAQHWIRHIFSHRPPTINWNKPSYAQESGRFLEIIKSRIHPQTVQICSRKGAKLYYDKMIALWHSDPPLYIQSIRRILKMRPYICMPYMTVESMSLLYILVVVYIPCHYSYRVACHILSEVRTKTRSAYAVTKEHTIIYMFLHPSCCIHSLPL